MADNLNGLFISEILADNAGSNSIDTDGDGNTNKSDEFVELQNASGATLNLDGYEVWSQQNGLLYSFGAGDTIGAGETATIVGNYDGTVPSGFYSAGISEGSDFLQDGENDHYDTLFLVNTNAAPPEYVTLSYGEPPQTPVFPAGFPAGAIQVGTGETILSDSPNGVAFARDENGDLVETTPTPGTPDIPCFLLGTQVTTEQGEINVEDLTPGMKILTKDSGYQTLRGIGVFKPSLLDVLNNPKYKPVHFPAGSIGNDRDLYLSQTHRVYIVKPRAELLFGVSEVLAAAQFFSGIKNVQVARNSTRPTYFHLLFDNHELIQTNGTWTESLFLGDIATKSFEQTNDWTFEDKVDYPDIEHTQAVRTVIKRYEAMAFLSMSEEDNAFESGFEIPKYALKAA